MTVRDTFYAEDQSVTTTNTQTSKVTVVVSQAQGNLVDETDEWLAIHSYQAQNDGIGRFFGYLLGNTYGTADSIVKFRPVDLDDYMSCMGVDLIYPQYDSFLDILSLNYSIWFGIQNDT